MKSFVRKIVIGILRWEVRLALWLHRPKIIAITGSVGKTSTKEAIACALTPFFSLRKSVKSYNSDFGVPLTVLGLQNAGGSPILWFKNIILGFFLALFGRKQPQWLVVEVGAGEPGDIRKFAKMLSPDIVVVTRFAEIPVHVEFFSSPEAVISEKTLLVRAVQKGGTVILGADDPKVAALANDFKNLRALRYGVSGGVEVRGADYAVLYEGEGVSRLPSGVSFKVMVGGRSFPLSVYGVLGEHLIQPVLAGFAVASALNLDFGRVAQAFEGFTPPAGRMRLISGLNDSCLIDDSYNASPVAMSEALSALASLSVQGRKVAIVGGMAELGQFSPEEHRKVGVLAARSCSRLVVVGELAQGIAVAAREAGMPSSQVRSFKTSGEAAGVLASELLAGDVVLIKGSASVRMERVVKALMKEKGRAAELLVRQESEWRDR